MQENLTKSFEKPCPPPVPPKTKHYLHYKDFIKSLYNPTFSVIIDDDFKHDDLKHDDLKHDDLKHDDLKHDKLETKSTRCPPPVPPKPRRSLRFVTTFSEVASEDIFKSKLRSKTNIIDDVIDKRRGMLVTCQSASGLNFHFPTGSNLIDAFTTEDRDLFSNSQPLSIDVQNESSEESFIKFPVHNGEPSKEGVIENIKYYENKNLDILGTSSFNFQQNTSRESLNNEVVVASVLGGSTQGLETFKRVKLTGSASFTSFDNMRNSSAKEVNLKNQIFKQFFERCERKTSHQNLDNLCLAEGDFSDEEGSIEHENSSDVIFLQQQPNANKTDQSDKLFRIACELLKTEESYVKRLHLIDQVFHFKILMTNREQNMFPKEQIVQMFPNIKSIYEFHRDFLLKHLRNRVEEWNKIPRIGDIMKRFAPFLKLYTGYVQNFDNAINVIKFWIERSKDFFNLLEELQKLPECEQMTLQHHMLEPIQRVPRYLVLMREYIKYLPEDSIDRSDSLAALDLVQKAASHSNESLRVCDQFQRMVSINERLGNMVNVIYPGRKFIKEGMLKRISPKDGTKTDRYLFLFHDMLLICQGVLKLKHHYKIKMKLDTSDIQLLEESHSLQTPESFHLICKEKYLELLACDQKSRKEWINALNSCISSSNFRRSSEASQLSNEDLGKRAPLWTKNQETSMCMICTNNFTFFLKKRHCHACGIVVCTKCSLNKVQLEFMANRAKRVCDKCFTTLQGISFTCPMSSSMPRKAKCHHSLKMKAFDSHVLCGYLKISQDRKNWQDLYVTINDNFVLYTFKAHKDVKAHSSLPLPGYSVDTIPRDPKIFIIFHKGWSTKNYFSTDSESVTQLWIKILRIVAEAELPQGFRGCLSQKCPHHSMLS